MNVIEINPKELFFLAKCMKAKYIDYSYIKDVCGQKESEQAVNEIVNSLEEKEYVFAGFDGSIEIDSEVSEILEPVFFGETEIRLIAGDRQINYHVSGKSVTVCRKLNDLLSFSKNMEKPDLENEEEIITEIVVQTANVKKGYKRKEFHPEQIDQVWEYIASELERGR